MISINDVTIKTHVNTYPKFDNQIVLSTLVKNEDKYIIQWIKYYMTLGVTVFVIYDNSNDNTLSTILSDYIRSSTVVLIHWPYKYYEPSGVASGQVCHINHAIYNLKTSKYVGFFDVDEYLNPQISNYNLDSIFDRVLSYYNLKYDEIGSFRSLSKFFINNQLQNEDGFEFMKVGNCQDICIQGYEKHFIVPRNIDAFCVHSIIKGKPDVTLPTNIIFHNHYCFLNKPHRGRTGCQIMHIDNSIIRFYRILTFPQSINIDITQTPSEEQCASPPIPVPIVSQHTESSSSQSPSVPHTPHIGRYSLSDSLRQMSRNAYTRQS
jgi:hypothetical protein